MNKGKSVDCCLPKFFKVYLPGESGDDLKLPISFNSYRPNHFPKNVTVKSIYGNVWKFELRKCCDGFVMVNGWKNIVKDEDLTGGEFLVFEFDGSRLFSFCIYGHTTCKRLRSLLPTKETEDKSMDDIIVLSDDEGDNDDQNYGEEDKSSEDIIVMGDDDSDDVNDVQDYGDQDKSSDTVVVLSDGGDDDDSDDADYYYASDGNADDKDAHVVDSDVEAVEVDDDDDDDDDDAYDGDDRKYLDDHENPSFKKTLNPKRKSQLRIPSYVIKDYSLNFSESITVIDPLVKKSGTLVKKIKIQKNGSVFVTGFGSVIRRNQVKTTDRMIFELKKTGANLVHTIKVYIISA